MNYSDEEFNRLLEGLVENLLNANHHFRLYTKLEEALADYEQEINQCRAFWGLTISAHREVGILNLCRAYDGNKQSLSLERFLEVTSENIELFSTSKFRDRLKDNPYLDSLSKYDRVPSFDELDEEKKSVSNKDPLVKKLTILRSNIVAHTNEGWLLNKKQDLIPLTFEDVKELIDRGFRIFNKYRSLFEASTNASSLIGEDDYKTVLKYYRIGSKSVKFFREIEFDLNYRK